MLKTIILACILSIPALAAEPSLSILSIAESTDGKWILVDRSWRKDCPKRIEVKLKVTEDMPSKDAVIKAYFYDKDKKLVYTYEKPCTIWEGTKKGYEEIDLPPVLKKNSVTEVYFALTPELMGKFPKTTLIVFGTRSSAVVKTKNSVNPLDFDFPEKSKIAKPSK